VPAGQAQVERRWCSAHPALLGSVEHVSHGSTLVKGLLSDNSPNLNSPCTDTGPQGSPSRRKSPGQCLDKCSSWAPPGCPLSRSAAVLRLCKPRPCQHSACVHYDIRHPNAETMHPLHVHTRDIVVGSGARCVHQGCPAVGWTTSDSLRLIGSWPQPVPATLSFTLA